MSSLETSLETAVTWLLVLSTVGIAAVMAAIFLNGSRWGHKLRLDVLFMAGFTLWAFAGISVLLVSVVLAVTLAVGAQS